MSIDERGIQTIKLPKRKYKKFKFTYAKLNFRLEVNKEGFTLWQTDDKGNKNQWVLDASTLTTLGHIVIGKNLDELNVIKQNSLLPHQIDYQIKSKN